jgi:hypothetical protein
MSVLKHCGSCQSVSAWRFVLPPAIQQTTSLQLATNGFQFVLCLPVIVCFLWLQLDSTAWVIYKELKFIWCMVLESEKPKRTVLATGEPHAVRLWPTEYWDRAQYQLGTPPLSSSSSPPPPFSFSVLFYFIFLIWDLMCPRLTLNSWAQMILLPQLSKYLGQKTHGTTSSFCCFLQWC